MKQPRVEEYVNYFLGRLNDPLLSDDERDELIYKVTTIKLAMGTFMVLTEIKDILQIAEVEALSEEEIQ